MTESSDKIIDSTINYALYTVKGLAKKNKEKGTWPSSEASIWALRAGAPGNGFGKAFITIGRRVLIDEGKFWEAVAHLQEGKYV